MSDGVGTFSRTFLVTVIPVVHAPTLTLTDVRGRTHAPLALGPNIVGATVDTNGEEALSYLLGNVPTAATLQITEAGRVRQLTGKSPEYSKQTGTYTLTPAQVATLTISLPTAGVYALQITAVAKEGNLPTAATTRTLHVTADAIEFTGPSTYAVPYAGVVYFDPVVQPGQSDSRQLGLWLDPALRPTAFVVATLDDGPNGTLAADGYAPTGPITLSGTYDQVVAALDLLHYASEGHPDSLRLHATAAAGGASVTTDETRSLVPDAAAADPIQINSQTGWRIAEDTPLAFDGYAHPNPYLADAASDHVLQVAADVPTGGTVRVTVSVQGHGDVPAGALRFDGISRASWLLSGTLAEVNARLTDLVYVPPAGFSSESVGEQPRLLAGVAVLDANRRVVQAANFRRDITVLPVARAPHLSAKAVAGAAGVPVAAALAGGLAPGSATETLVYRVVRPEFADGTVLSVGTGAAPRSPDDRLAGVRRGLGLVDPVAGRTGDAERVRRRGRRSST